MDRLPYEVGEPYLKALGIEPHPEQLKILSQRDRFPVIGGGERGGKTFTTALIMLPHILMLPYVRKERFFDEQGRIKFDPKTHAPRNPDFVLFGPNYVEPRQEFQLLEDWLRKLGKLPPGRTHLSKPQDGPWRMVTTDGVVIQTWSMEDPESVRALDLEGAACCEAGKMPFTGAERVRGRVSAKRGFIVYSGCLTGDSLIQTDRGLLSLEELYGEQEPTKVRNRDGQLVSVSQFHLNGKFPTKRVTLSHGLSIEGTHHHKVQVRANARAGRAWKRLDELVPGDKVYVAAATSQWGDNHMAPDDAYLAGLYLGDGSAEVGKRGGARITITCGNDEAETQAFLKTRGFTRSQGVHWRSTAHAYIPQAAGIDLHWKAGTKRIPRFIRCADRDTQRNFLAGLFDADGCAKVTGQVTLASVSREMLVEVQNMLLNFGIFGGISEKRQLGRFPQGNSTRAYVGYTLSISAGKDFQEQIGFRLKRKAERALAGRKQRFPARQGAKATYGPMVFATVKSIADGEALTYDLSVPDGRSYTANGIVTHNTMEHSQQWYRDWMLMGKRENRFHIVSYSLPTFTNLHEFPGGRDDPEIKLLEETYTDDVFAMRVLAEPRPQRDRVLKEVSIEHIKSMRIPSDAQIEVWVDPGYASAYAVLFVAIWEEFEKRKRKGDADEEAKPLGKRFYVFDELYEQGCTTDDIISLVTRFKFWPRIRNGVIDIASKAHHGSESALEKWQNRTNLSFNMRYWSEDALIERIRSSAKSGQITIDPKCRGLIAECALGDPVFPEMHPWKYHTDREARVTSEKPIDKWNHSAKALGYGLLHHLGQVERVGRGTGSYNRLTGNAIDRPAKPTGVPQFRGRRLKRRL